MGVIPVVKTQKTLIPSRSQSQSTVVESVFTPVQFFGGLAAIEVRELEVIYVEATHSSCSHWSYKFSNSDSTSCHRKLHTQFSVFLML